MPGSARRIGGSVDSSDSGQGVEVGVERDDPVEAVPLHGGEVEGVAGLEAGPAKEEGFGPFHLGELDGENVVDDPAERVERRLDRVAPVEVAVATENLLKHLGAGDQLLAIGDGPLEEPLGVDLVGVGRPDQVHRDVRVDEDHGVRPRDPWSMSRSMVPMSAVG
mgnify:CR=1 FL=1